MPPVTPLLDTITEPAELRALGQDQLRRVAEELRAETIDTVSTTGGHLGSALGVDIGPPALGLDGHSGRE